MLLLVVALGVALSTSVHGRDVPPGWAPVQRHLRDTPTEMISLTLHLFQRNLDLLDRKFWEVHNNHGPLRTGEDAR